MKQIVQFYFSTLGHIKGFSQLAASLWLRSSRQENQIEV